MFRITNKMTNWITFHSCHLTKAYGSDSFFILLIIKLGF